MQLTIINSNSQGNCYILANDQEALIIECGVRFDKIKQALNFKLNKVVGCLITHEHNDHSKAVKDIMAAGISVYASQGTMDALGVNGHHRAFPKLTGLSFFIGGFRILPFDVKHDAAQPVGFLINHQETGNILFITDSYYCEYSFKDLHNVIVEANYCQTILDRRLHDGESPKFLRDRVITSHMSLATCKDLLKANDLSLVNNIVLIHLSDGNSDAVRFKTEVEGQTGKPVTIAEAGMTIPFNKQPF